VALTKVGFVREGLLRQAFLRNEVAYDVLMFGLLRDDLLDMTRP
jgi:RimJ/RimL family protein N-acetyltransferase